MKWQYLAIVKKSLLPIFILVTVSTLGGFGFLYYQNNILKSNSSTLQLNLQATKLELDTLKQEDQIKINQKLAEEIKNISNVYKNSIAAYEKLTDLKAQKQDTSKLDIVYAQIVKYLADKNYASGSASLTDLNSKIESATPKVTIGATPAVAANAPQSNTPPGSGFSFQRVDVDGSSYNVAIVAADLGSTKVIVDTASDSDCANDCPTLSLADYVSRSGAYAGINGSFFCPKEYPSCAGKTGSFDTLLMNKNKHYFNSDNNVYSTIPAAIFSSNSARFVGKSQDWGRDTSVDSVIANYPLLVSGDQISFSENPNEPKFGNRGARTFVAARDNNVYIGVIYNATMGESAKVLKAM